MNEDKAQAIEQRLADAIIALLADAPRRRRLGQAARQRLYDVFSPVRSVERLIEFYQEKLV